MSILHDNDVFWLGDWGVPDLVLLRVRDTTLGEYGILWHAHWLLSIDIWRNSLTVKGANKCYMHCQNGQNTCTWSSYMYIRVLATTCTTINCEIFVVKIFSDRLTSTKIKHTKIVHIINANAVRGRLSENYLTRKNCTKHFWHEIFAIYGTSLMILTVETEDSISLQLESSLLLVWNS
jgi:hypothetical protein